MPIKRSSIKDVRRILRRRARNQAVISRLRSAIKKVEQAATPEEARKAFLAAESLLDKAGRKGYVHHATASRKKSRLAKMINKKAAK